MIMLKKILQYSVKPRYCGTLLSITGVSVKNKWMSYSWLALKHCVHEDYNFHSISRIFNYIFHSIELKFSHSVKKNEVENLCDSVLSQDFANWGKERIEDLKTSLSFLLASGYSRKEIKETFVTHLKSSDCSYTKLKILSNIYPDITLLLPLLSLPITLLELAAKNAKTDKYSTKKYANRIQYLSHHLELEPSELILHLTKHTSLLTMKFDRLHTRMNVLKNAGISSIYIVKDLWIFNYNEELLASRIHSAVKCGIELKPWMLRSSKNVFESILHKYSETQRILGSETLHTYLAKKLDCSIEYVDYILMEKNKFLKSINVLKLDQVINFLFEKGYTADEIRLFPKVFSSSPQTLKERFEEFQHLKSTLPSLAQLSASKRNFNFLMRNKKQDCYVK